MKNTFYRILLALIITNIAANAFATDGLITVKSAHNVTTTIDKLQTIIESKGMTVFTRIDHTAGASKVDIILKPTQVLIFGNPRVGTPLMQCSPSIAIDLPQKALAWEDDKGDVWLSYNGSTIFKNTS